MKRETSRIVELLFVVFATFAISVFPFWWWAGSIWDGDELQKTIKAAVGVSGATLVAVYQIWSSSRRKERQED